MPIFQSIREHNVVERGPETLQVRKDELGFRKELLLCTPSVYRGLDPPNICLPWGIFNLQQEVMLWFVLQPR